MDTAPFAETLISALKPDALRADYLRRLRRLLGLRRRHLTNLNTQGLRLIDHSIFAAYCDCREAGAEQEARAILREAQFAIDPSDEIDRADNAAAG